MAYVFATVAAKGGAIASGPTAFKTHVVPFLRTHCVDCPGPTEPKGQLTLHDLIGDLATKGSVTKWENILRMIESGELPPEDAEQPQSKAFAIS